MKKALWLMFMTVGLLFSCEKDKADPLSSILGQWKYEYQLLDDGSRSYNGSYSLLEHTYSDGFILYKNNKGNTTSGGGINDSEFEWRYSDSRLIVTVPYSDGSTQEFEYILSNVEKNSMNIQTPKGIKYFLKKE